VTIVPERICLHPGDSYVLELPGLGTAGFVWDEDVDGDPGVIDVSWSRGLVGAESPGRAGESAPERATIRAVGLGSAALTVYQHRRWESGVVPRKEHHVVVIVCEPETP
jgi:hypothetical protein